MPLPNTVRGWEKAGALDIFKRPAPQPKQDPRMMLAQVLSKVRTGSPMTTPGEGMIPWAALPSSIRQAAEGALTSKDQAPIGFAPSDFTDPAERAMLERMVQAGAQEQAPNKVKAEAEAQAKLDQEQAMLMAQR